MRFVNQDKDFLGKEKTLADQDNMPWVCAYLEIEPDGVEDGHGGEAVFVDGQMIGSTSSVAYGHSHGKILAFAYVKPHVYVDGAACEVMIAGEMRKGRFLTDPVYDPKSELPRMDS